MSKAASFMDIFRHSSEVPNTGDSPAVPLVWAHVSSHIRHFLATTSLGIQWSLPGSCCYGPSGQDLRQRHASTLPREAYFWAPINTQGSFGLTNSGRVGHSQHGSPLLSPSLCFSFATQQSKADSSMGSLQQQNTTLSLSRVLVLSRLEVKE